MCSFATYPLKECISNVPCVAVPIVAKVVPLALTEEKAPENAVTVPKGVVNPLPLITAAACIPADAVTSPVTSIPPALTFTTSALLASKWISFAVSKSMAVWASSPIFKSVANIEVIVV